MKKTAQPEPDEIQRKALTLHATGMAAGDIARALSQYGVTVEQVQTWMQGAAA